MIARVPGAGGPDWFLRRGGRQQPCGGDGAPLAVARRWRWRPHWLVPPGTERTVTMPIGPVRLTITLAVAAEPGPTWEEGGASGLSDRELAQLNGRNTRSPEAAAWEQRHPLLVSGPWP